MFVCFIEHRDQWSVEVLNIIQQYFDSKVTFNRNCAVNVILNGLPPNYINFTVDCGK